MRYTHVSWYDFENAKYVFSSVPNISRIHFACLHIISGYVFKEFCLASDITLSNNLAVIIKARLNVIKILEDELIYYFHNL